jgi:uncharacterized repeat protein (TIGR02543 family)
MTSAKTVTATFTLIKYTLTVTKSGIGSDSHGTITSNVGGINCGSTCSASYDYGTSVTLTAVADAGYTFAGWNSGCSGGGTCTLTIDANKTANAVFLPTQYGLDINGAGNGGGTISSNPAPGGGVVQCVGGAIEYCEGAYAPNTSVTLTATPKAGSTFGGWSGACSGTSSTCTVIMNANKSVTATFNLIPYPLTVTKAGNGSGTVTSAPTGINCGSDCSETYNYSTSVTLTTTASTGSTFTGWSGSGCSGTGTCTVIMDAAKSVYATFTSNNYTLTVKKGLSGIGGTVTSSPAGINCGSICSASFNYNTTVTLTATAAPGSMFTGWSGACTGSGSCIITMTADKLVTALFRDIIIIMTPTPNNSQ